MQAANVCGYRGGIRMKAQVKDGKLIMEAEISANPPYSKSGKSRIAASTNGFINVQSDDGKTYQVSVNLIVKGV
jgi:hypothetical protein